MEVVVVFFFFLNDGEYKWMIRGWERIEKDHSSEVTWKL